MSIISQKNRVGLQVANVVADIANIYADHRGDLFTKDLASQVISLESLAPSDLANVQMAFETVREKLERVGLRDLIIAQLGGKVDESVIATAMESAAISLMAAGSPDRYHSRYVSMKNNAPSGSVVVDTSVPGIVNGLPSMESFTVNSFDKFAGISVVVSALTLAQSNFDELFFPSEVIAAGDSGISVKMSIPYAYNRTKRAVNGSPFQFEKKSLIHAVEDYKILEGESTTIYPHAGVGSGNDSFLVAAADVGNKVVVVNNVDVETRPILFGKEVDLLAISAHPGVIGNDQQNETDALDPNVSIGKVYIKIEGPSATGVFEFDLDGIQGAMFVRPAEGTGNALIVNFNNRISLNNTMKTIGGVPIDTLGLNTALGLVAGDPWSIDLAVELSGKANSETGNIKVHANGINLDAAFANDVVVAKSSPEYLALSSGTTISLVGYLPKARRVNANLRMKGIFIDNSETHSYFFPIQIGSPIASVHPISSEGSGATVEGLVHAVRIRSSNTAITTLLAAIERIKQMSNSGNVFTNATTIGTHYVKPTYLERTLDVKAEIEIERSGEGYDDLRAFVIDEITTIADKLALESRYLSALESFVAGEREYEVIIGTDPRLAGLLMKSGDIRTLGEKHAFRIESTLDLRCRGKIFISFRRKNKKGIDPLSFGAHLVMPGLVHEVANSALGGATVQELQVQPRELHTVTLPIIGILNIEQLDNYHKRG